MISNKTRKLIFVILLILLIILLIVGFIFMSNYNNHSNDKDKKQQKSNEVTYKGYTYLLPSGCDYRKNYQEEGISKLNIFNNDALWNATITVVDIHKVAETKEEVFSDYMILQEALDNGEQDIDSGQLSQYGSTPIVSFHYFRGNMKYLLAYIPAYDDNMYCIRLVSSRLVDEKEDMFFDYETLNYVIDILKTGKKK